MASATAPRNEMIKSDVIVPESDLQTMLALDRTSQACSKQLVEAGTNEAVKALIVARSVKQFKSLLSDAVMSDIMELQNSPLGFRTDKAKDGGYSLPIVRDCVVQAFMRGLRVTPRATRRALATASAPELTKRICSMEGTAAWTNFANSSSQGVGAPKMGPKRRAS